MSNGQSSSDQPDDIRRFVDAFVDLLDQVGELRQPAEGKVSELIVEHLGVDPSTIAPVGQRLPRVERPNLQLAMDYLMADDDRVETDWPLTRDHPLQRVLLLDAAGWALPRTWPTGATALRGTPHRYR